MVKGKLWKKIVERLSDINFEARDKVIRVKNLDDGILIKAEVVGVKGIVCLEKNISEEGEIPVKVVSESEWKKLL